MVGSLQPQGRSAGPVSASVNGRDDAVGGVGQVGEAVGQAGAGEDEAVGVLVFGDAELGQQVQVVAQGLQFGVGLGGQVVAGVGERSVLHGGVLPRAWCSACGRGMRPQGVGRFETADRRRAYFPEGCFISRPPDAEQSASAVPDGLGTKNPPGCRRWEPLSEEIRRSLEASLRRGWRGVYLHLWGGSSAREAVATDFSPAHSARSEGAVHEETIARANRTALAMGSQTLATPSVAPALMMSSLKGH